MLQPALSGQGMNFPRATPSAELTSTFAGESCKDQHFSSLLLPQEWKSHSESFFGGTFGSFFAVQKGRKVESRLSWGAHRWTYETLDAKVSLWWDLGWCSNGFRVSKVQAEMSKYDFARFLLRSDAASSWIQMVKGEMFSTLLLPSPVHGCWGFGDTSADQKLLQGS